jgi:hypothetical protein
MIDSSHLKLIEPSYRASTRRCVTPIYSRGQESLKKNATMPGFYHGNPHQLVWQDHGYLRQSVKAGVPVSYKRTSINKKIRQPARYRVSE